MHVTVLYFGVVRERFAQAREEQVSIDEGGTVRQLLEELGARHPGLDGVRGQLQVAVNEAFATPGERLRDGDVVALIPPVAGGSDGPYCRLSTEPLDLDEVIRAVTDRGQGAIVTFIGVVREHNAGRSVTRLEYEAYAPVVLSTLAEIIARCQAVAPSVRVAVTHRVGDLEVGQPVVMIAASAPQRAEAFAACRTCIELLKQEVPIWKKEIGADGEEWIGFRP
jgi:MoaE-MoaD fusion protein